MQDHLDRLVGFRNNSSLMGLLSRWKRVLSTAIGGSQCTQELRPFSVVLEMRLDGLGMLKLVEEDGGFYHLLASRTFLVLGPKPSAKRAISRSKATRKKSSKRP